MSTALVSIRNTNRYSALTRNRNDTGEICLGADAFVTLPDNAMPAGAGRVATWSERVRALIARGGFRVVAAVTLAGFAWLCQRGS